MKKRPRSGNFREEILREWRGTSEPPDLNSRVHLAKNFISAILQSANAEEGLNEDQVRGAWKEIAGDFIGAHTEPLSFKGGNLILCCTQPALRFQLEQMKPMLLSRIKDHFGEDRVKSIKFSLG